jgi:hypothetical protein
MKRRRLITVQAALALLAAALVAQVAQARLMDPNGEGRIPVTQVGHPLGYTPAELKALQAYSNASFAQRQVILAGADRVSSSSRPEERAGSAVTVDKGFDWGDASAGAVGALCICVVVAGGMLLAVNRGHKPALL